ncbi:MAG: right-handed parallel beta-helix repeat-containing protein [Candidatus Dormibacteraeota bacterium]|nr:right-handed parallel beta-helix repeat-containing protein [Candidatus Dormibacteraeota bacterium]
MIFRGLARSRWPIQRAGFFSRNLWKVGGLGIAAAVLLTSRGASEAPRLPQLSARVAAAQSVPCGPLAEGVVTWSASNYILPSNDPFGTAPCAAGVIVGPNTTLIIDAAAGPVQISSSGAALNVAGGTLETANTDATHIVSFQAAPDVASWEGINITASGASKGNASLSYVSIQGALRSIQISSGATRSPADSHYGLTVSNSGIGFSYFDGIDALDTPISITGLNDGRTGTINNIGSIGISAQFSSSAPALLADALHVDGMTFGSSAPFGVSNCPANQPCYIGNEAIFGKFASHANQPVSITNSNFYRAGNYGVQLESANQPTLTNNLFVCNGLGAPTTGTPCGGSGPVYSAVSLTDATADLAQAPTSTGQITGNHGYGNGLDAIAFNGAVTSHAMTWQNATNVTSVAGDPPTDRHWLGYLLTGDLNMVNATLTIPDSSVVKTLGGTINLTNSTLDASSGGPKTFTSLRDKVGIVSCPTVFGSCGPDVLPGGEWGGINLSGGSKATINNANILYAATGIRIAGGATSTGPGTNYGLIVSNSTIGPTFSDGIAATATPISVTNTHFQCAGSGCQPPAAGDHGISADFTGSAALGDGLLVAGNTFHGSVNEAIKGVGLGSQKVDIENNSVDRAGTAGIQLVGADRPTLKQNTITSSGTGTPTYPAIYLNGVTRADFSSAITGNAGSGNGLDAIAFHGGTTSLTWRTVANSTSTGPFGYLLDGPVAVNGNLILPQNAYVPSLGSITVTGGALTATGAVVTSLKDSTLNIPTCGSVFDQKVSGACPVARPGDWTGLTLDSGFASSLSGSEIRYAATGIAMGQQGSISGPLTLNGTNLRNMSVDGIATQSSLAVSGGAFSNIGGRAIAVDLTGIAAGATVSISGASIGGTGSEGILARGLAGQVVLIDGTSVDRPRATGISLTAANHLTLTNNTITNTPAGYPAIYLNGFTGPFGAISGNRGAGNGLDALAFHGTVTDDLTWITARKTGVVRPLGYLLDGDLNLAGTLQVGAGDIVKSNGALNVGHLRADNTSNAGQKVFTSLSDDVAGLAVCHPASVLLPGCTGAAAGDWSGINLAGDGALVNSAIRYAATGINVSSGAATTFGSSSYGLLVSRSHIDATKFDAIDSLGTPASVTDSSINGAIHGVQVDFTGGSGTAALRLSGNRFSNTGAEAVVGQALGGHPLWITDNQVQNAATFGVRLVGADKLVLRNNNVSGSGGGPSAGAARYPAIWLSGVTADFTRDVRGNVGSANGLDAIVADGTAVGNLNWITPSNGSSTHALGYLLDGGFIVDGGTLTVPTGGRVQVLGGAIKINGGAVNATGATFTSLKDGSGVTPIPCPSVFVLVCVPAPGDWGGLMITEDSSAHHGSGTITGGRIAYAATGISIDSGPIASGEAANFRLSVSGTEIAQASNDGISSTDTPISVNSSTISGVGAHGVIASFFSPANCAASPAPCSRLSVTNSSITGAGKDGIVANGLAEQPVTISHNTITSAATYGIRLVGANELSMDSNTVNLSGSPGSTVKYPAIYLNSVTAEFGGPIGSNAGTGNGLNALVFHGTANNGLTWITPSPSGTLGYMLDGPLTVNGPLNTTGVVKVLTGAIKVNGVLTSVDTAFTSMRDATTLPVCNTVFVPSGCPSTATAGDWGGINVDPVGTSTFTRGSIAYATSGLTISSGDIDITGATLTRNSGYALTTARTGTARLTCTGIHHNGGGILANGAATSIDNSDLYGNATTTGKDFDGTSLSTANRVDSVWWNGTGTAGAPAPTTQYNPLTVIPVRSLPQQEPSIKAPVLSSVQFSSDNTNSMTGNYGRGTLTVTLMFDRTMNLSQALDVNFSSASDGVLHPVIGTWTGTDGVHWVGHAPIDETSVTGQPGINTVTVKNGMSCMRDGENVMVAAGEAATQTFTLDFTTATVGGTAGATHLGATHATLNDTINPNGWSLPSGTLRTDTYGFFQLRADTDPVWGPIAIPTDPTLLLGYHVFGSGNTPAALQLTVGGLVPLSPNSLYHYRAVAVDLNGIATGPTHDFTTTDVAIKLVVAGNPTTTAGQPYKFTVTAEDGTGQTVKDYTGTVAFTLAQLDSGASPLANHPFTAFSSSTPTIPGDDGSAAFTQTLTKALGQTVIATDTVTATITGSLPVTVNPAAATQVVMGQQPGDTVAGASITPAVTALVEDQFGNVETGDVGTEHQVTVGLTSTSPSATLLGTTTQPDVAGVATFSDLSIHTAHSGYALHATSGSLTAVDSGSFAVTPAVPSKLAFTTQPSGSTGGVAFGTQPVVAVEDAFGNVETGDSASTVMLTINAGTGDPAGVLTCATNPQTVGSGSATFAGCAIDKTSPILTPYTLHAASNLVGVSAADSGSVAITLGPAAKAAFTTQPSGSTGGIAFGTQPVVAVEDAGGNVETGDNTSTVSLSLKAGTGDPAGVLTCTTNPRTVSSGSATFAGCAIDKVSPSLNPYTLHAASNLVGVSAADSGSVAITLGPAAQLAFTTQPSGAAAGTAFGTQPVLSVEDAGGNRESGDNSTMVTLSITPGTGQTGAALTCTTNPQTVSSGAASFSGCAIDLASASQYRLHASGAGFQTDSQALTVS